ncbi:MAG TPA: hypothetical protein VML96_07200 [Egibacteraceae bacterium]|nr:hypothetical protein [Egibacteraceae bacterium]
MIERASGAGRAGGLLFLAVLLLIAYLVIAAVAGLFKIIVALAAFIAISVLARNVLRRR